MYNTILLLTVLSLYLILQVVFYYYIPFTKKVIKNLTSNKYLLNFYSTVITYTYLNLITISLISLI